MLRNLTSWNGARHLLRQLRDRSSANFSILRAALLIGAASAVVKLVATGRELVVAGYFGLLERLSHSDVILVCR